MGEGERSWIKLELLGCRLEDDNWGKNEQLKVLLISFHHVRNYRRGWV